MPQATVKINAAMAFLNYYRKQLFKITTAINFQNHCCNGILKQLPQAAFKIIAAINFSNHRYKQH